MRIIVAAVVTWDDLKTYFGKGSIWRRADIRDDRISVSTKYFSVEIEPKEVQFAYKVEAADDPSDSEEGTSADPLKDIAKFLGQGVPGGEFFEKRSSGPEAVSAVLRAAAVAAEGRRSRAAALRALRRASVLPHLGSALAELRPYVMRLALSEAEAFEDLRKKMEEKDWRVKEGKNDAGAPKLTVDVGGVYTAEVEVDSILYDYVFQVVDRPDLTKSGTTEDPIGEFQRFYRDPDVSEAEQAAADALAKKHEEAPPESFVKTVPAKRGPEIEEKMTVPTGPR